MESQEYAPQPKRLYPLSIIFIRYGHINQHSTSIIKFLPIEVVGKITHNVLQIGDFGR